MSKWAMLLGVLLIVLMPIVYASLDIQESNLDYGSSSQEKSSDVKTITLRKPISLQLSPGSAYSSFNFEFSPSSNFQSSYISVFNTSVELNLINSTSSQSQQFYVNITVPKEFDAIKENTLEASKFSIGRLKMVATANGSSTERSDEIELFLQTKNSLKVNSVKIDRDGQQSSISKGSAVQVAAGETVDLIFEFKNEFSEESGTSMSSVNVKVKSSDLNIDETKDGNSIDPQSTDTTRVSIDIPEEETGTFDVNVEITAEDEFQGLHGEKYDFKFNVAAAPADTSQDQEDLDADGVPDINDFCPGTKQPCKVDESGCEIDSDRDGICDALDQTPQGEVKTTANNEPVQSQQNQLNATEDKKKNIQEVVSSISSESFEPFMIGLILGVIVTAGFFIFIRS